MGSIKAEYVNPFISNAIIVFEQLAGIELKKTVLKKKPDPSPDNDVSIIVGVAGFVEGQVVYSLKKHTADRIAMSMIADSNKHSNSEILKSAIAEIANIITGRATISLSGKDRVLNITPPVVIVGKDYNIELVKLDTIAVYFTSRFGTMEINIALREKKS